MRATRFLSPQSDQTVLDRLSVTSSERRPSARRPPHLLYHDQHEKYPSCLLPLNRSSTKTTTEEENEKKCTRVDVGPAARSVCVVSVGLHRHTRQPHRMQCIFREGCSRWKTQVADGKGRSSAHTHSQTHF